LWFKKKGYRNLKKKKPKQNKPKKKKKTNKQTNKKTNLSILVVEFIDMICS
jgi:hypothetical protein